VRIFWNHRKKLKWEGTGLSAWKNQKRDSLPDPTNSSSDLVLGGPYFAAYRGGKAEAQSLGDGEWEDTIPRPQKELGKWAPKNNKKHWAQRGSAGHYPKTAGGTCSRRAWVW